MYGYKAQVLVRHVIGDIVSIDGTHEAVTTI